MQKFKVNLCVLANFNRYVMQALMGDLNTAVASTTVSSFAALDEANVIRSIVDSAAAVIMQSASYNEVALAMAQKVFKRLYEKTEPALLIDIHITILLRIHDIAKSVVKELTNWILYSDNDVAPPPPLLFFLHSDRFFS